MAKEIRLQNAGVLLERAPGLRHINAPCVSQECCSCRLFCFRGSSPRALGTQGPGEAHSKTSPPCKYLLFMRLFLSSSHCKFQNAEVYLLKAGQVWLLKGHWSCQGWTYMALASWSWCCCQSEIDGKFAEVLLDLYKQKNSRSSEWKFNLNHKKSWGSWESWPISEFRDSTAVCRPRTPQMKGRLGLLREKPQTPLKLYTLVFHSAFPKGLTTFY